MKLLVRMIITVLLALIAQRPAYHFFGLSPSTVSVWVEIAVWSAAFLGCYVIVLVFDRAVLAPVLRRARG